MRKPWRRANVLIAAEQALASRISQPAQAFWRSSNGMMMTTTF
jgi:hypothetical protein